MQATTTIFVIAFPDGFKMVFNMIAMLVAGNLFASLLKLAALWGIILTLTSFITKKDPMVWIKWIAFYTLTSWFILIPKTTVSIVAIAEPNAPIYQVANVPWVAGKIASLFTTIGYGLTQQYESLLSDPDSVVYSKTGLLFGSHLMQSSLGFHIVNPELKSDMNAYFRQCVVGDIAINRKYSVSDLKKSNELFGLVFGRPSPVRRVVIHNPINKEELNLSCSDAAKNKKYGLEVRLQKEINNAYTFFGKQLFSHQKQNDYKQLFEAHLGSAYAHMQGLTNSSADIVLQTMMGNAIHSGLLNYSAHVDSSAAILNSQFAKSQAQHRAAWSIGTEKAIWFLPLLHTVLMVMLFALFPLIFILASVTGGLKLLKNYLLFVFSLQFWPVLFSILNAIMVKWGQYKLGEISTIAPMNFDSLDAAHQDLAGVAGFLMMSIPFIAKGLVSNIGEAFSGLATAQMQHLQGSSMSVANEVASASYSLGNNSFYNTTANSLSANKHDSNYTDFNSQRTEQALSGATETLTGDKHHVFNASPAITQSAISIASTEGLQQSLSRAAEKALNAQQSDALNLSNSLSSTSHHASQFNDSVGHDTRLGQGISKSDSVQAQQALAHAWSIAEDVAHREGISTEEAFSGLTRHSYGVSAEAHVGIDSKRSILGHLASATTGIHGGASASASTNHGIENSTTDSNRNTSSHDLGISNRDEQSFRNDLSIIENYAANHHYDSSGTKSENLLVQVGHDLREAKTFSESFSASIAQSQRIAQTENFVSTHGSQLNHNLNQEAIEWAIDKYGHEKVRALENHPHDAQAQAENERIKSEFLDQKVSSMIQTSPLNNLNPDDFYQSSKASFKASQKEMTADYSQKTTELNLKASSQGLGINSGEQIKLEDAMAQIQKTKQRTLTEGAQKAQAVQSNLGKTPQKHHKKPK
jgi:conjugal transfer mating pair stabilization protein TraG